MLFVTAAVAIVIISPLLQVCFVCWFGVKCVVSCWSATERGDIYRYHVLISYMCNRLLSEQCSAVFIEKNRAHLGLLSIPQSVLWCIVLWMAKYFVCNLCNGWSTSKSMPLYNGGVNERFSILIVVQGPGLSDHTLTPLL